MTRPLLNDLRGKAVLITGGTMGIGLATGLAFGRLGAQVWLTHRWGSADENEVRDRFAEAGAPEPRIECADVTHDEDTDALLREMKRHHDGVEAYVANVAFAQVVRGFEDYSFRGLASSIEATAWPLASYSTRIRDVFGSWPRYIVGLSSAGPDRFHINYDFVAASKAVLETLARYMSHRLFDEDARVNVVRARPVSTASLEATVGPEFEPFVRDYDTPGLFVEPEDVAHAVVALCSGFMDAVRGQVLTVDRGADFADNLMRLYDERESLGLVEAMDGSRTDQLEQGGDA